MRVRGSFLLENYVCPPFPRITANNKHRTNRCGPPPRGRRCRLVSWISPRSHSVSTPSLDPSHCSPLSPHHRPNQSITPARLSTHIFDCSANMSKFILRPPPIRPSIHPSIHPSVHLRPPPSANARQTFDTWSRTLETELFFLIFFRKRSEITRSVLERRVFISWRERGVIEIRGMRESFNPFLPSFLPSEIIFGRDFHLSIFTTPLYHIFAVDFTEIGNRVREFLLRVSYR